MLTNSFRITWNWSAWLVVLHSNDAAHLAPIARVSWMLAGHVSGPIRGHPVACPRWHGRAGSGRPDHCDPHSLGGHGDDEVDALTFKPDFHSLCPLLSAPNMSVETTPLGSRGIPFYGWRARGCGKSGFKRSTREIYPGSGRK